MQPSATRLVLAGSLTAVALLGGCSSGGPTSAGQSTPTSPSSDLPTELPPDTSPPPTSPGPSPDSPDSPDASGIADSPTCDQVRAGIAAFNAGDFAETVARFEAAVPLARRAAAASPSAAASALQSAVGYYARLAPEDYLDAAQSSPQFARNKAITLGLCGDGVSDPQASPTERGIEA